MSYQMPFGKFKGQPVSEVPTKQLEYYSGWDQIKPETKAEVDKELAKRRGGDGPATTGHGRPAPASRPTAPPAGKASASAITARARDIVAIGADRLQACAHTNEALGWLLELLDGTVPAPDDDVPF